MADTDKPFINTTQRIYKLEQTILQQAIIIEELKEQCKEHATTIEQLKECITTQKQPKPQFNKGNRAIYSGKIMVEIVDTIVIEDKINYTILLEPNTITSTKKITVPEETLQLVNYNISIPIYSNFNTLHKTDLRGLRKIPTNTKIENNAKIKLLLGFGEEIGLF